ncbi:Hydrocephalus-inducing-like protein, partial [Aduncisulcus paluster]
GKKKDDADLVDTTPSFPFSCIPSSLFIPAHESSFVTLAYAPDSEKERNAECSISVRVLRKKGEEGTIEEEESVKGKGDLRRKKKDDADLVDTTPSFPFSCIPSSLFIPAHESSFVTLAYAPDSEKERNAECSISVRVLRKKGEEGTIEEEESVKGKGVKKAGKGSGKKDISKEVEVEGSEEKEEGEGILFDYQTKIQFGISGKGCDPKIEIDLEESSVPLFFSQGGESEEKGTGKAGKGAKGKGGKGKKASSSTSDEESSVKFKFIDFGKCVLNSTKSKTFHISNPTDIPITVNANVSSQPEERPDDFEGVMFSDIVPRSEQTDSPSPLTLSASVLPIPPHSSVPITVSFSPHEANIFTSERIILSVEGASEKYSTLSVPIVAFSFKSPLIIEGCVYDAAGVFSDESMRVQIRGGVHRDMKGIYEIGFPDVRPHNSHT